ncbi:MAG TPA: YdcF family protein [Pseudolabrys sp.]|nr:YdcF family protein [Pseudolabrys sp.]
MTVSLLAAGLLVVGGIWFIGQVPTQEVPIDRKADGIVVLTGGASRVADAVELLSSGKGQRLLISGVHPYTRAVEIARLVPVYQRVFACCVDLDRSALNTLGNAIETRRWVKERGFQSLIVVTSNYHLPRAMAELEHQLPDVTLIPYPVVTERMKNERWWSSPTTARLLLSEYLKYVFAVIRMRLDPEPENAT